MATQAGTDPGARQIAQVGAVGNNTGLGGGNFATGLGTGTPPTNTANREAFDGAAGSVNGVRTPENAIQPMGGQ